MPVYETPYGTVDAPDLGAAQKWIAGQKGAPQGAGTAPAATQQPPEQKDAPGGLERLWQGIVGKPDAAGKHPGMIGGAWDRLVAGKPLLGIGPEKNALVTNSEMMAEQTPYRPGIKMGEMMPKDPLANPMVMALGTGNIGARAPAVGGAAPIKSRAIEMGPDQAALAGKGVEMTPGQVMGGMAKGAEDTATSFPILGHFIQNARGRSIQSFNTATINQALEPIGASLPKTVQVGNDAIKSAGNAISKAYEDVLGRVPSLAFDPELKTALDAVSVEARKNPDVWRKFAPILKNDINTPFSNAGRIEGKDFKIIDSELARQARGYARSEDFDKQELGRRLTETRHALMDAVERQYPAEAANLQNANASWAMLTRIEQAAGRRKTSEGVFTPNDLLQASASQAGGVRRREFARGDALFQTWAQTAQRVLPSTIPDSGTAGRLLGADLVAGAMGMGGMMTRPGETAAALGGLGAASLPYAPPVSRAIQRRATPSGPAGQRAARMIADLEEEKKRGRSVHDVSPPPSIR